MNKLYEYQIVKEIIESGNLTLAANNLNLSRSAVSKQLSALESRLGVQLIERSTKSLAVTEVGKRFYQQSLNILNEVECFEESLLVGEEIAGLLSISIPPILSDSLYMDVIADFAKNNPRVNIDLRISEEAEDLVSKRIDFAIRLKPIEPIQSPNKLLDTADTVIFTSKEYAKNLVNFTLEDIADHPFIIPSRINLSENVIWKQLRSYIDLDKCHWVEDARALLQMVQLGMGISIALDAIISDQLATGSLINLLPGVSFSQYNITLMTNKRKYQTRRALQFEEAFLQAVSR